METLSVRFSESASSSYPIIVGSGLLREIPTHVDLTRYSRLVVLSDRNVAAHWLNPLKSHLKKEAQAIVVPAGEEHKNVQTLAYVWGELAKCGADRKTLLLGLGGGVIGDMAGFAAASYMRGIDCVQIPTTLLAQVDASVGGKTAIDHAGVKNLVGSFTQPKAVCIDVDTLATLPEREFTAAFAEILKHGMIHRRSYFDYVASKTPREFSTAEVIELVMTSVKIKAALVEADEREGGPRKLLNLGHTAGHAIESLSYELKMPLLHGEAVSLGLLVEAKLAQLLGRINRGDLQEIRGALQRMGLPVTLPFAAPMERLFALMRNDKKSVAGKIYWTLLTRIGEARYDLEAPDELAREAFSMVAPHA